jgi:FtsP/CotA-like multicopper oxidase with cupredoxin domain
MAVRQYVFRLAETTWDFGGDIGVQHAVCFHQFIDSDGFVVPEGTPGGSWQPFLPGPTIRGRKDDVVLVTVQNRITATSDYVGSLREEAIIHWHGIELGNRYDGTPVTQTPIATGSDFAYRFKLARPGCFWYHPHWNSLIQDPLGAYGPIICEDAAFDTLRGIGGGSKTIPHADKTWAITLSDLAFEDSTATHVPVGSFPTTSDVFIRNIDPVFGDENFGDVLLINGKHRTPFNHTGGNDQQFWEAGNRGADNTQMTHETEALAFYLINSGIHRFYRVHLAFSTAPFDPSVHPDDVSWTRSNALLRLGGEGGLLVNPRAGGSEYGNWVIRGWDGRSADGFATVPQPTSDLQAGEFLLPTSSRILVAFEVQAGWRQVALIANGFSVKSSSTADEEPADMVIASFEVGTSANPDHVLSGALTTSTAMAPTASLPDLSGETALTEMPGACTTALFTANGVPVPPNLQLTGADATAGFIRGYDLELVGVQAADPSDPNGFTGPSIDSIHAFWDGTGPGQPTWDNTRYVPKGAVIEWTVATSTNATDHPWHMHGFSFQPIKMEVNTGGGYTTLYTWDHVEYFDSFYVPFGHRLTYRFRVEDRPIIAADLSEHPDGALGRWLGHCHVVKHAGRGMMMNFFVVDHYCDTVPKRCSLITDRSHFSVQSLNATGSTTFTGCFFLVLHGFRPTQLAITTPTDTPATSEFPITIRDAGTGAVLTGMTANLVDMHLEVADVQARQRIALEYDVVFSGPAIFPADGAPPRVLTLEVAVDDKSCSGQAVLFRQKNPFMLDGPTHWLSEDLRVFQIQPGDDADTGVTFAPGTAPKDYLAAFLTQADTNPTAATNPFNRLPTNQQEAELELSPQVEGTPVHNFAVARVRYEGQIAPADDVRVFFRSFTTAVTNMAYDPGTYATNAAGTLAEFAEGENSVLTIPYFSVPRGEVDATTENVKTIPTATGGNPSIRHFGVILDINDPATTVHTDPADSIPKSVRDLIDGRHQCLVAEIAFGPDPIPVGATPTNNDNLSQRNLAFATSGNPGPRDEHVVAHTFDLTLTAPLGRRDLFLAAPVGVFDDRLVAGKLTPGDTHDELIILWGDLPRESVATLFMPDLDADAILHEASQNPGLLRLHKVDAHTIRCDVGDISYVPLPVSHRRRIAGLLTIELPIGVKAGQSFDVVVRQHDIVARRIVGQFQLTIPVRLSAALLVPEMRWLNVMRSIGSKVLPHTRWYAVWQRYLGLTTRRVTALGGDPDDLPSEGWEGTVGTVLGKLVRCCRNAKHVGLALALAVLLLALAVLLGAGGGSTLVTVLALLALISALVAIVLMLRP